MSAISAPGPTRPLIQWVPVTLSTGVKWPGRKADLSPPSNAEVKNAWSYAYTPSYVFMAWLLVKHRDYFTFRVTLFLWVRNIWYNRHRINHCDFCCEICMVKCYVCLYYCLQSVVLRSPKMHHNQWQVFLIVRCSGLFTNIVFHVEFLTFCCQNCILHRNWFGYNPRWNSLRKYT